MNVSSSIVVIHKLGCLRTARIELLQRMLFLQGSPRLTHPLLKERLQRSLSRKSYLREKLIRTDHHLSYFQTHQRQGITPKGVALERKYNLLQFDSLNKVSVDKIEDILSKAERKIHSIMIQHYERNNRGDQ